MKRQIIKIDEEKCTGCGDCVKGCPEGALQIINGKAKLVGELLCDGLGACIGTCPEGAITVEEREAEPYDENKVMGNIVKGGKGLIVAHLKHLKDHRQTEYFTQAIEYLKEHNIPLPHKELTEKTLPCGCPGTMSRDLRGEQPRAAHQAPADGFKCELCQWPIQLQLLSPYAPYFKDADLVVAADCVPFAYPNFHERFLKGKILIIFCPKLDRANEIYLEKLTAIMKENDIKSITILHMEVPCCFGTSALVEKALSASGKNVVIKDYTISVRGEIV